MVIVMAVVVIVGWVVWIVAGGAGGGSSTTTSVRDVSGDWSCEKSTYTFYEDGSFYVRQIDGNASSIGHYTVNKNKIALELGKQVTIGDIGAAGILKEAIYEYEVESSGVDVSFVDGNGETCRRVL